MYHTLIIAGNVGKDPEMRYTPSGQAVTSFSVATNRQYTNNNGETVKETIWFRISAWGKMAETCNQYLKKGSKVYIEGSLRTRQWEKDGVKHYTTEIIANDMQMLDRVGESSSPPRAGGFAPSPAPAGRGEQDRYGPAPEQYRPAEPSFSRGSDDGFDDDIPF